MMGSERLDISVENLWLCWQEYKKGKKKCLEFLKFEAKLEKNLFELANDLNSGKYRHGGYFSFVVRDNKKRLISVASIRDRVVHRLLYKYLVKIYDHRFDFDIWSCRRDKGLVAAIFRCRTLAKKYSLGYFWRADIRKFFENVDKQILLKILNSSISDKTAMVLVEKIVISFGRGLSIGNLTSQILANIYLNEFDRFVRNELKPQAYMRYGDDFILFEDNPDSLIFKQKSAIDFLNNELKLEINSRISFLGKISNGIRFLGCLISPGEINLNRRNKKRIFRKLNSKNISSYYGLLQKFGDNDLKNRLTWELFDHT